MLLGLAESGIAPELIVGTSVGAVNGGWVASRADVEGIRALADLWRSLSRQDVFPTRPIVGLLGFLGLRSNLVPNHGLRRLLKDHLQFPGFRMRRYRCMWWPPTCFHATTSCFRRETRSTRSRPAPPFQPSFHR
ncbi:putative patatin-like phospholipase [Mycobacterium kansasii]|uniref:Putative patatin-like phospholipase n=1 Tax=Mycobacterium kansasii TaxID=1768 RepID=A0A1V3X3J2_MYCKA|nr:putative patatin-like phospholipase [Mycobacterium kansasii]